MSLGEGNSEVKTFLQVGESSDVTITNSGGDDGSEGNKSTVKPDQHLADGNTEKEEQQPSLLQLFAEEKCGKDAEGLAFFEQIAAESNTAEISDVSGTALSTVTYEERAFDLSSVSELSDAEIDEIYNAWIPCERTKHVLSSVKSSSSELFHVEKEMITTPTLVIADDIEDPIKCMLDEITSITPLQRRVITAASVSPDEKGLKKLIGSGFYHSAINLTTQLLKSCSVGNTLIIPPSPQSLQLWFIRMAMLLKLRKFSVADVEGETFGNLDNPDLYYEFYGEKYGSKKGSMVPFSLRLLLAELPQYNGNSDMALNKLYAIRHIVLKIKENISNGCSEDGTKEELSENRRTASLKFWTSRECRVLYSILSCFLSQRDYVMAIEIAQSLLEKDPRHTVQLYSALGRIYLQLGDVKSAQDCFDSAFSSSSGNDRKAQYEMTINKALLAVALGESDRAYNLYREALVSRPADPLLTNNLSVCLLYMGKLKESLSMLEQAIQKNPKAYLHDNIMFNICTLYELESSYCNAKKQALLKLVSKFADDGFSVSSLKIPAAAKT